jgi:hypothetical protein
MAGAGRGRVVTGWVISILVSLFNAFDGITKLMQVPQVVAASKMLGYTNATVAAIGAILLVFTGLYLAPRTVGIGALLLTAYYGGAFASTLRVGAPAFEVSFAAIFGVIMWIGAVLRQPKLETVLPGR